MVAISRGFDATGRTVSCTIVEVESLLDIGQAVALGRDAIGVAGEQARHADVLEAEEEHDDALQSEAAPGMRRCAIPTANNSGCYRKESM